ncbi:Protein gustavu [Taenia crassiceps]|uniref:Protein gustavu n=1 Tax=Taenia crassiceps TaxID=6207 RepID=A0ABR4QCQ7_9CEST
MIEFNLQYSHVVLAPDLPTWDENQPSHYRKIYRHPHRLLRLPDANSFPVDLQVARGLPQIHIDFSQPVSSIVLPEKVIASVRAATWRIHWPEICRGTCACIGVSIHSNTPGSAVDRLLCWDLAHCSLYQTDARAHVVGLPAADFTMTLTLRWTGCCLKASLIYHFADQPLGVAHTLHREVWLARRDASSLTLFPFVSTAWGFAEVEMRFVGFLQHGVLELKTLCRWRILQQLMVVIQASNAREEFDIWSSIEQRVKDLPFPKAVRDQFRLFNFRKICGEVPGTV